jgi:hypothetical protein
MTGHRVIPDIRLLVRFDGESALVSMRPHLLRVLIEGGDGGR